MKIENVEQNTFFDQKTGNNSLSEILEMGKANHPQFWISFVETHPDFLTKLLNKNSKITVAELNLCAFIYLGFSTKEVAEYTFRSLKTIENMRYNLRKKLDLSPDDVLFIWLRNYLDH